MFRRIFNVIALLALLLGFVAWSFAFSSRQSEYSINPHAFFSLRSPVQLIDFSNNQNTNFDSLSAKVNDAVVAIDMYRKSPGFDFSYSNKSGLMRYIPARSIRAASGTGFLINPDGYILTNAHVVFDSSASYMVAFQDGRQISASVVYKDSDHDLAVLKVDGNNYQHLNLGDSKSLKPGNAVMGIGNAYGEYQNIVSTGKVQALNQRIVADGPVDNEKLTGLIQSDAPMYPGDSGGPLFDAKGNVVAVNVAVSEDSSQSFSIPINVAKNLLKSINVSI